MLQINFIKTVDIIQEYLQATTVHGFSYLHPGQSAGVRLVWVIVILIGFSTTSYMIHSSIVYWDESPVITTLDSIAAPIQKVQFPTVTVCPEKHTPPNNWAYVEKVLNAFAFECYDKYPTEYPDCSKTEALRKDFKGVLAKIINYFKRNLMELEKNVGLDVDLRGEQTPTMKMGTLILEKKINYGELTKLITDNFLVKTTFKDVLSLIPGFEVVETTSFQDMETKNIKFVTQGLMVTGLMLSKANGRMPFGTYLRHFFELNGAVTFSSKSTMDEFYKKCESFTNDDNTLHDFLKDLTPLLGFNNSNQVSLFDIPSMVGLVPDSILKNPSVINIFPYTQCKHMKPSETAKWFGMDKCYTQWHRFLETLKPEEHPCDFSDYKKYCCNTWTNLLENNLEGIMTVMRMASKRGNNVFNASEFMGPFMNNPNDFKYNINNVGQGFYSKALNYDGTSYIAQCSYAGQENRSETSTLRSMNHCNLFKPMITDMGICYSFNSYSLNQLLEPSPFVDAIMKVYKNDLPQGTITSGLEMGVGSGSNLALEMFLDNNGLMRPDDPANNFRVGIAAADEVFEMRSVSKLVKPGFKTIFEVIPMEVYATPKLSTVSMKKRNCRFSHEVQGAVDFFSSYSQAACQFECMVKMATEICRCTPWNMPFSFNKNGSHQICDLYGHNCFDHIMDQQYRLKDCDCLVDCNAVRFSITEKEVAINPEDYCTKATGDGLKVLSPKVITVRSRCNVSILSLFSSLIKVLTYWNSVIYHYYKLPEMIKANSTWNKDANGRLCAAMMKNNVAVVVVKFGSHRYVRTIMDKRVTLSDQIASLGGTLSLFTGMSFLSMFEVLFWIFRLVKNLFKKK